MSKKSGKSRTGYPGRSDDSYVMIKESGNASSVDKSTRMMESDERAILVETGVEITYS